MRFRVAQGVLFAAIVIALTYLVITNADGWADWVVFAVILLAGYGAAVAVSPRLFARRKRTISREAPPRGPRS